MVKGVVHLDNFLATLSFTIHAQCHTQYGRSEQRGLISRDGLAGTPNLSPSSLPPLNLDKDSLRQAVDELLDFPLTHPSHLYYYQPSPFTTSDITIGVFEAVCLPYFCVRRVLVRL